MITINDIYQNAMCKIEQDQKCKPACVTCVGATGPTHPVKSENYPNFISHYTNGLNL